MTVFAISLKNQTGHPYFKLTFEKFIVCPLWAKYQWKWKYRIAFITVHLCLKQHHIPPMECPKHQKLILVLLLVWWAQASPMIFLALNVMENFYEFILYYFDFTSMNLSDFERSQIWYKVISSWWGPSTNGDSCMAIAKNSRYPRHLGLEVLQTPSHELTPAKEVLSEKKNLARRNYRGKRIW